MKIIHVIPSLNIGGAETMMKNLIVEQANAGHNVKVVAFYQSNSSIRKALESIGVGISFIDKKLGVDLSTIVKLKKIFDIESPDVIHTHLHVLPYVFLASGKRNIVHTVHTVADKERNGIAVYLTRMIYRSERVTPVAISDEIRKSISQFHNIPENNIPIVLNGAPISSYFEKEAYNISDKARIIHVGSLIPLKNHELMINAASILKKKNVKFQMEFAGAGYLKDKLQETINNLHLDDCVKFAGLKDDISLFLKDADLFILPSKYEGVPMSLIEAMASGLPIIASNVGGIPDMIDSNENGILINPDASELAETISKLLADNYLRETLGREAVKKSKEFSSETMYKKYMELYQKAESYQKKMINSGGHKQ